jgi:hypothetical protein
MQILKKSVEVARDLSPVFIVAVAVVLASTVAGSVLDHVHKANADSANANVVSAVASAGQTQTMTIGAWGVQFTAPLASAMPLLSYASGSSQAVGLSSADLEKLGPQCGANRNALGLLTRNPAGSFGNSVAAQAGKNLVATIGAYDYVYKFPQSSCSDSAEGMAMVNREESILFEALGSLAPVAK